MIWSPWDCIPIDFGPDRVQLGGTAITLRCAADVGSVDMHFRIVREVRAQPYGDARTQAQLLRDHMIMPLLCVPHHLRLLA